MKDQVLLNHKITDICDDIISDLPAYLNRNEIAIVGIDGPTAAGKTIFADHLANAYHERTHRNSFVYRLDWTLASRDVRVADLAVLKNSKSPFQLEAELHMRLNELESFLKKVAQYNDKVVDGTLSEQRFRTELKNLYSREDSGRLTGSCIVEIPPGSLIIVEGHYSLRSELHKYFDLNTLLLSNKSTLIDRKVARVSGYRNADDAVSYFHIIDAPSFEHHLNRYGQNATHVIQNDDFANPKFVSLEIIKEWCNQPVSGEIPKNDHKTPLLNSPENILNKLFSESSLVPGHYKEICATLFSNLDDLDKTIAKKIKLSVEEQSLSLTQVIDDFIRSLNAACKKEGLKEIVELKFTNSLHNVYFRIFPVSLAIGIQGDPHFGMLIDVYEEKIEVFIAWKGGYLNLASSRSIDIERSNQLLEWVPTSQNSPHRLSSKNGKTVVLVPTSFTVPPIFPNDSFDLKITGKEQLNISSSECFRMLTSGNLCWVARLSLQGEVDFFSNMCQLVGAQTTVIGNYLIAIKTNDAIVNGNFKAFSKGWRCPIEDDENISRDKAAYDLAVIGERDEIESDVGENPYLKVLDTHIFLKNPIIDGQNLDGFLEKIKELLLSKNRLLRKRTVQFIGRQFGVIELPISKIWDIPQGGITKASISIDDLVLLQPTIMAEIYLWMSIKRQPSAILGANVYDISKNSLDANGHIRAAIDENSPIVLQASLNALGPKIEGEKVGYLQPKNGAEDLIQAIQSNIHSLYVKQTFSPPLYGIGLDHIDSRNDIPPGRARKFLEKSVATGMITHLVLDGSSLFSAKDTSKESLESAYDDVTKYAANLVEGLEDTLLIDKEICGGELNYIGSSQLANIPDASEINLFVERLKKHFRLKKLGSFLRRPILFIANVGTTHHSGDIGEVRSEVAGDWVNLVKRDLFVSAVLHGTTGTKSEVLKRSLAGCKKVNIAGDFLKTYVEALPTGLQEKIKAIDSHEPKRALVKVRGAIEGLPTSDRRNVSESIYEHTRSIMQVINSPSLSTLDKEFFRHSPYLFSNKEASEIIQQIKSHITSTSDLNSDQKRSNGNRLATFCASLIEVPYGQNFIDIARELMSAGIINFHIDVGDGKLITRKFSGLAKLRKLRELNPNIVTSTHLMVRDPHLTSEEEYGQSYIKSYAENGCNRIGIHLRSVSDLDEAKKCFDEIRQYGSHPGIILEVDEPFNGEMGNLILKNGIDWLVVMGVRIGFGGQIFNSEVLQKIASIKHFAQENNITICIEIDGGLTMSNIGACRQAGADLFAGWSIVKPDDSMSLNDKLEILKHRL